MTIPTEDREIPKVMRATLTPFEYVVHIERRSRQTDFASVPCAGQCPTTKSLEDWASVTSLLRDRVDPLPACQRAALHGVRSRNVAIGIRWTLAQFGHARHIRTLQTVSQSRQSMASPRGMAVGMGRSRIRSVTDSPMSGACRPSGRTPAVASARGQGPRGRAPSSCRRAPTPARTPGRPTFWASAG